MIFVNDIQRVHLLALILVKPLHLNIKDRVRIQPDAFLLQNISGQRLFLLLLDAQDIIHLLLVMSEIINKDPEVSPYMNKLPVAGQKPPAEGDSVGLIVEFFRVKLIKAVQLRLRL